MGDQRSGGDGQRRVINLDGADEALAKQIVPGQLAYEADRNSRTIVDRFAESAKRAANPRRGETGNENWEIDAIDYGERDEHGRPILFGISKHDVILVEQDEPSICPNAKRTPHVESLPLIKDRFRNLRMLEPGQTIHWVGGPDVVCDCFSGRCAKRQRPRKRNQSKQIEELRKKLVGEEERNVLQLLVQNNGLMDYPDFLVESGIHGQARNRSHASQLFNGLKGRLRDKIDPIGWLFDRKDNDVVLKRKPRGKK